MRRQTAWDARILEHHLSHAHVRSTIQDLPRLGERAGPELKDAPQGARGDGVKEPVRPERRVLSVVGVVASRPLWLAVLWNVLVAICRVATGTRHAPQEQGGVRGGAAAYRRAARRPALGATAWLARPPSHSPDAAGSCRLQVATSRTRLAWWHAPAGCTARRRSAASRSNDRRRARHALRTQSSPRHPRHHDFVASPRHRRTCPRLSARGPPASCSTRQAWPCASRASQRAAARAPHRCCALLTRPVAAKRAYASWALRLGASAVATTAQVARCRGQGWRGRPHRCAGAAVSARRSATCPRAAAPRSSTWPRADCSSPAPVDVACSAWPSCPVPRSEPLAARRSGRPSPA